MNKLHRYHNATAKLMNQDKYLKPPNFHYEILDEFNSNKRFVAEIAPVGFAKSTISKTYALYSLLSDSEDKFVLYVSSTYTKACQQIGSIKKLANMFEIGNNLLYKIDKQSENNLVVKMLDTGEKRCIQAIGANQDILGINFEGERPSLIIIDDIEEEEQARNLERTEKLIEWILVTLESRLPSVDKGKIRYIGTNLDQNSITNRLINKNSLKLLNGVLPFQNWHVKVYKALDENEKSIWEDRHSTKGLLAKREANPFVFAKNYQNEPIDASQSYVKAENIRYYSQSDLNLDDFVSLYMHADLTGTSKTTSDYYCPAITGKNKKDGNIYLIDFKLIKAEPDVQADIYVAMYSKYSHKILKATYDEKGAFSFAPLVKEKAKKLGIYISIEPLKYPNDKITHLNLYLPVFNSGSFYVPREHPDIAKGIAQLTIFNKDNANKSTPKDDFIDGVIGTFDAYLHKNSSNWYIF